MEKHLEIELLKPDKLIKVNELKEITNPIFFIRDGVPTSDGLLSNEIFGISKDERGNIFAYIDLGDIFIHPLVYKAWVSMDSRIRAIVHGTKNFSINEEGYIVEDEDGESGVAFLKKNIDKIKIRTTESNKRDIKIKFVLENKDKMFINSMIVIPAYYRDVNTDGGKIGVGEINQLYNSLIIAVRSLKETADYGIFMSNSVKGRVQEILLQIYQWFADEPNLSKKHGIVRRAVMSKTADYATRLVLSAPELKVESLEDLMVDLDYSAVPLASVCTNLFPYIIFYIRRFFENEFGGVGEYPYRNKDGEIKFVKVKDPLIEFSDARIKKEIERFMFGYSNRFIPIEVPNEENRKIFMHFKGRQITVDQLDQVDKTPLLGRRLTWCDLIFMAAVESAKDKHVLITRYPLDNYFGQFPTKIAVASTKETEPMYVDKKFYKHYPKIREEDIGTNTSNRFVDTINICNLYLSAIGGDYDGDQVTAKAAFTLEANEELDKFMNSKAHYISLGANNIRTSSNEAIQALYNLTLVLPGTKLTDPIF